MNPVALLEKETQGIEADAEMVEVKDSRSYEGAANFLLGLKELRKKIDETFDGPIAAAHKAHREMIAAKKKHEAPVAEAELLIKLKMSKFISEQDKKRITEEKAIEKKTGTAVTLPSAVTKVEGISRRKVWRFEITDASVLPREYLMPDEQKIGGVVRAMKNQTRIPGVRVWEDEQISARA